MKTVKILFLALIAIQLVSCNSDDKSYNGKYIEKHDPDNWIEDSWIELKTGKYFWKQGDGSFTHGEYTIDGDTLYMTDPPSLVTALHIVDDIIYLDYAFPDYDNQEKRTTGTIKFLKKKE
jgi:hypothetical protein